MLFILLVINFCWHKIVVRDCRLQLWMYLKMNVKPLYTPVCPTITLNIYILNTKYIHSTLNIYIHSLAVTVNQNILM